MLITNMDTTDDYKISKTAIQFDHQCGKRKDGKVAFHPGSCTITLFTTVIYGFS